MSAASSPGFRALPLLRGAPAGAAARPLATPAPPSALEKAAPADVGARLAAYLGIPGAAYRRPPEPLSDGWETYTYALEFEPGAGLPRALRGPLVLRVYASPEGLPRAAHEFAVQGVLARRDFPVPRPVLLERGAATFGGPFVLMEQAPGRPLLRVLEAQPWRLWDLSARMARLHAALHRLPPDGVPAPAGPFLPRRLEEPRGQIRDCGLRGLRAGFEWLAKHRPAGGGEHILHLDWHPLNLLLADDGRVTALDWAEADVGDRHADVATALLLARCAPAQVRGACRRLGLPLARGVTARHYLRTYRKALPVDGQRLSYYGAWAALHRLTRYGRWLAAGPACTGAKPSALTQLRPALLRGLARSFRRHTGVNVRLS
jgi:aminoglycoside phosphotransferase (APT) family kinase protein